MNKILSASQAIETTRIPQTGNRDSGIRARCQGKPRGIRVPWDHNRSGVENHAAAALALARIMNWHDLGSMHIGATLKGYVVVWSHDDAEVTT